jgi:hypothetical protein
MPVIRAATVLSRLTDGIKARFECKTEITVTRFDEIKHNLFNRSFFDTVKLCDYLGWREKEGDSYIFPLHFFPSEYCYKP